MVLYDAVVRLPSGGVAVGDELAGDERRFVTLGVWTPSHLMTTTLVDHRLDILFESVQVQTECGCAELRFQYARPSERFELMIHVNR